MKIKEEELHLNTDDQNHPIRDENKGGRTSSKH